MATVRELQAQFIAKANGFKSTIQGIKKDVNSLAKDTNKATSGMGKGFKDGIAGLQSNMNKASSSLRDFGDGLGHASKKVSDVGWSLTKKLTLPAGLATAAVGGLVAKLGWDRLKSVDEAQAQLKGLGYTAEDVERITGQVTRAIEGGMTTMGEGTAIAAGALAAGVKEGAELERYIRLVGDAAVGANRPVEEMAMIFNRVQGGGKLMTRELNMIEMGMPGFAQAMSKHLGVSQEAFREMVTDGKVSSKDFLIVMDDFAGGMAAAYSETWRGMVANTKAYVAILGENLLKGVFKKSKESIAEFIELISSPEVQKKAAEMGESLGRTFTKIVDGAKSVVKWFMELDTKYQKMIMSSAAIAVALGPFLIMVGKVGSGVAYFAKGLGVLIGFLAKTLTPIKSLSTSTSLAGRAFTFLSGTAGVVIGWIGAFVGVIVMAYQKSEPFRNSISNIGTAFKNLWERIKDLLPSFGFVKDEFGAVKSVAMTLYDGLKQLADVIFRVIGSAFAFLVNKLTFAIDVFVALLSGVEHFAEGWKRIFSGDFKGAIESFSTGVKKMASNVKEVFSNMLSSVWGYIKDVTPKWVKSFLTATGDILKSVGTFALELPGKLATGIKNGAIAIKDKLVEWKDAFTEKTSDITVGIVEWSKDLPSKVGTGIKNGAISIWESLTSWNDTIQEKTGEFSTSFVEWAKALPGKVGKALGNGAKVFEKWIKEQHEENKEFYGGLAEKAGNWLGEKVGNIKTGLAKWGTAFTDFFKDLPGKIGEKAGEMYGKFSEGFLDKKEAITDKLSEWGSSITKFFKEMPGKIKDKAVEMFDTFKQNFLDKKNAVKDGLVGWKDGIFEWFSDTKENVKEKASGLGTGFKDGIVGAKDKIVESFNSWLEGIKTWFKELTEKKEIKDSGKEIIKTVGKGIEDKETQDDLLAKVGQFILKIPLYILGIGAVLFFAVGRELIKGMGKGITGSISIITKAIEGIWTGIQFVFNWGIETVVALFTTGFIGKIIRKAGELGTNFKIKISEMWQGAKDIFFSLINTIYTYVKESFVGRIISSIIDFALNFKQRISEMWTNLKETFTNRINTIYDYLKNSFVGRIITSIINFSKSFREKIVEMWTALKTTFTNRINTIYNYLRNSFVGRIIASIIDFAKNFKTNISNMWTSLKNTFTNQINTIFNAIKNSFVGRIISSIVGFVRNFKENISSMWSNIKNRFDNTISSIRSAIANSFVGRILESGRNLKTNFIKLITDMWDGVKKQFNNIVDGAKALPGRIGDGIRSARQKAINGMKSVGNALIRWGGIPFNKVVDGVNWITTKLGVKKNIGKWDYPQYAKGTGSHPGGHAILGDGIGNNAGPELTTLPDGKAFMSADSPTLYPNLPKGTEVLSATDTRRFLGAIPQYAKGTSKYNAYSQESKKKRQENTKKALKKGNESIDDVWSYIKSPGKLLNLALEKFGAKVPDNLGNFKDMITGAFGKVKSAALSKVKDTFKKQESAVGPAGPSSPGAAAWRSHIKLASATMNANASNSEINGIIAQINRESGGNQRIVQSNAVWDVNTAAGNPARGLLQYIPQTFNAYKTRGHGNIYSGYDQLRAFFNNSTWRRDLPYGRRGWGPRGARRGYADGGIVDTKQLAWIAEGGWAESIISHDPAKHASQKSIWEKTGNALGFTDENDSIKLLKRITEILEKEKDGELLKKIATAIEKGHIIEMDKTKIADILHEPLKTKDAEYSVGRYF